MRKMSVVLFLLLLCFTPCVFAQKNDKEMQIGQSLRQTEMVQVSCGEDVDDFSTCKIFARELPTRLHIDAVAFYEPEVMVQSFFTMPRFMPIANLVTVRLIEIESRTGTTTLHLGGFCWDPGKPTSVELAAQLPRWSVVEGSDAASAARKLALEFSTYWHSHRAVTAIVPKPPTCGRWRIDCDDIPAVIRMMGGNPNEPPPPYHSPESQPPVPQAQTPQAPPEEITKAEDEADKLNIRATTVQNSIAALRQQQRAAGFDLRADISSSQDRMQMYLAKGNTALKTPDLKTAQKYFDLAETELGKLEKFLGR